MGKRQRRVFSDQEWKWMSQELRLSARQMEVLQLVLAGMSDKQIAREIGISFWTVRTHVGRLFKKFEAEDRAELMIEVFAVFRSGCREAACPRLDCRRQR